MGHTGTRTVLIANPSADVYGSDLQMLESISAMTEVGWRVVVVLPDGGRLVPLMTARGADVRRLAFPVLRRANASPIGILKLLGSSVKALALLRRALKQVRPDVLYVNTVTLPWWLLAAKLARIPCVVHVHEAEDSDGKLVLTALTAPLLMATAIIANSRSSVDAMCAVLPALRKRTHLVYNGVPGPAEEPVAAEHRGGPYRLAIVARLSPRKAPDIALEAVALLRAQGRDVQLEVCGTPFSGYEWFERQLHQRAQEPDLAGHITWSGYVSPIWPALARAHAVVAPSLREPFGNAVVEAHLALRPVVASAALGHLETVLDNETGLLVPPGDAQALADAVARLMDEPELAARLAATGRKRAHELFSTQRYNADMVQTLGTLMSTSATPG